MIKEEQVDDRNSSRLRLWEFARGTEHRVIVVGLFHSVASPSGPQLLKPPQPDAPCCKSPGGYRAPDSGQ
jgi:hypothetical protein